MVLKVRFELTRVTTPVGFEPTASTVPPLEHMSQKRQQGLRDITLQYYLSRRPINPVLSPLWVRALPRSVLNDF